MYRFIVIVDVEADSLSEAYGKLHEGMSKPFPGDWESTDEVFGPDGEQIDPTEFFGARAATLKPNPQPAPQVDGKLKNKLLR